jgi:uncharacterized membrane protein HdeD (DUF308 family)
MAPLSTPLAAPPMPAAPKTAAKNAAKTNTKTDAKKDAVAAKAKKKPQAEIDWAEWTLRILGIAFLLGGIWALFATVEGIHVYTFFGRVAIVVGISMLKAGFPSKEDWKNDF